MWRSWKICANGLSDSLALFTDMNTFLSVLNNMFRSISVKLGTQNNSDEYLGVP
jgi:hypothetical protein